jgi:hypothetical protein
MGWAITFTVRDAELKPGKFTFHLFGVADWAIVEAQAQALALALDPLIGGYIESISVSGEINVPAGIRNKEISATARLRYRGNVKFAYNHAGPYKPLLIRTMAIPAWSKDQTVWGVGFQTLKSFSPRFYAFIDDNTPEVIALRNFLLQPEMDNPNFRRIVDPRFGQPLDYLFPNWTVSLRDGDYPEEQRDSPWYLGEPR